MEEKKSAFEILNAINVNDHTEVKDTGSAKLTYLSWAWAWAEVKKKFPDATYEIIKYNGIPYIYDPLTGFMVYTTVTIEGITHEMWLPVMDGQNRAMKAEPYEIQTKYKTITVQPATMFDVNKAIMRCLTKNLAMFGLGLYIYSGEDLPEDATETACEPQEKAKKQTTQPKASKPTQAKPEPVQQAEPQRSEVRKKLKSFCEANNVDQKKVVKDCGLNAKSTDEDFEKAYEYALKLAAEGELPFEIG